METEEDRHREERGDLGDFLGPFRRQLLRSLPEPSRLSAFATEVESSLRGLPQESQITIVLAVAQVLGFEATFLTTGEIRTTFALPDGRFVQDHFVWSLDADTLNSDSSSTLRSPRGVAEFISGMLFFEAASADLYEWFAHGPRVASVRMASRRIAHLTVPQFETVVLRWRRLQQPDC